MVTQKKNEFVKLQNKFSCIIVLYFKNIKQKFSYTISKWKTKKY